MRRDHQSSQGGDDDINMTPMLDIVFIMLIFFIVTASFVKEAGIDVLKPGAEAAQDKPRASILVAVSPLNEVWIQKRRVEIASIRPIIERLRAENPQGSIVIQADEASKSGTVMEVVDQVKAAGVTDISLSTEDR